MMVSTSPVWLDSLVIMLGLLVASSTNDYLKPCVTTGYTTGEESVFGLVVPWDSVIIINIDKY